MKAWFISVAVFLITSTAAWPQTPTITARGPDLRVWTREYQETLPSGRVVKRTSSFTEIATGMHYWDGNGWAESKDEILLYEDGARAVKGQHQAFFSAKPDVTMVATDGKVFRSRVFGLIYYDTSTGETVLISGLKDCVGQLVPPNQVIYADAFESIRADLRYTYTRSSIEQDVIIYENPADPTEAKLRPDCTRLQLWTEFTEAPQPEKLTRVIYREQDPAIRAVSLRPDLIDEELNFGASRIIRGRAFKAEENALSRAGIAGQAQGISVGKEWITVESRQFLIESVPYQKIKPMLSALPNGAALNKSDAVKGLVQSKRQTRSELVLSRPRSPMNKTNGKMQLASAHRPTGGVVLDYVSVTTSTNNVVFEAGKTYYINGSVYVGGECTIEPAILKYPPGNTAELRIWAAPTYKTGPYRMAILTARDDDTVGEVITDSTGRPTNYYAKIAIESRSEQYHYLRVSYANIALYNEDATVTARNCQIINCNNAFTGYADNTIICENMLMHNVRVGFLGSDYTMGILGTHLTYDMGTFFIQDSSDASYARLTNSLITGVTTFYCPNLQTNCVYINSSTNSGIYQTVGAGAHYLADNSTLRDAGCTNINLCLIASNTTYPPVVLSQGGFYTTDREFARQAGRDCDGRPDLGYHYAPLDYVWGNLNLLNATFTVHPGTAIATFATNVSNPYGVGLWGGARLNAEGSPENTVKIVRYNTVQEGANTNWCGVNAQSVAAYWYGADAPAARFRFTEWSVPGQNITHFYSYGSMEPASFKDCQFHSGSIVAYREFNATNCLFDRTYTMLEGWEFEMNPTIRNSTLRGGTLYVDPYMGGTWSFYDNFFDHTALESFEEYGVLNAYNAYYTNGCSNCFRLTPLAATDLIVSNFSYASGPLGSFYQNTNSVLVDRGSSTNAGLLGFFAYTTQASQLRETNSPVDIGFHYIAVDSSGLALDTDGDGYADWIEDADGDGVADPGEQPWNQYNSPGGLGTKPSLDVYTPLK